MFLLTPTYLCMKNGRIDPFSLTTSLYEKSPYGLRAYEAISVLVKDLALAVSSKKAKGAENVARVRGQTEVGRRH